VLLGIQIVGEAGTLHDRVPSVHANELFVGIDGDQCVPLGALRRTVHR